MNAKISRLVALVRLNFRCFGGGYFTPGNPISFALAEEKPSFAAGVDVESVVLFVLKQAKELKIAKKDFTTCDSSQS